MRLFPSLFVAVFLACGPALAEGDAPFPLRDFVMVPQRLASAIVTDGGGQVIGIVDGVSAGPSGKPVAIGIRLADGRRFTVPSGQASYDPIANHVITSMFDMHLANAR